MAVTWTKEQEQVIHTRNRNLLVSAAAGSGKTAVLVERIITRLTKDIPPVDVDQLLVVTYTEAAAAEMKERIGAALEKALEEDPDNLHLKKQAALIHTAKIMTIHGFCLSVIKEYFHTIDLEPGFRIAEEGELKLLKRDVIQEMLEAKYQESSPEFLEFVECFATGRDDVKLEEIILHLHEYAGSYPDPEAWLEQCASQYQEGLAPNSLFMKKLMQYLSYCIQDVQDTMQQAKEICQLPYGPAVYEKTICEDEEVLKAVFQGETLEEIREAFQKCQKWPRLAANKDKDVDEGKIAQVKALRESWKDTMNTIREDYVGQPLEELDRDMKACYPLMRTLVELVKEFGRLFAEKKADKTMIDFHDMEQFALQILTRKENGGFFPSEAAKDYQKQFVEVMVDEYQDSNLLQETILTSVSRMSTGENNMFMVGDVKQSIYRFRLSRPELFMEKYDTYSTSDSQFQRIDLHKNFRSRAEVLNPINAIFRQIMTKKIGGIVYDDHAALYVGAEYPEGIENRAELLLINTEDEVLGSLKSEEAREAEVQAIAGRIQALMEEQVIWDKKTESLRPIQYGDIVILSRSLKGYAELFLKILPEEGIPVMAESQEGYFETLEISWILNYLRVLDNYRQDIPLAAVLKSPLGKCTNEELAQVREAWGNVPFHEAVLRTAGIWWQEKEEPDFEMDVQVQKKIAQMFDTLEQFRKMVPYTSIHELLWNIVKETGYRDYISAMPGGEQRVANLDMLLVKAKAYEKTSYKGLFHFVRYMDQMKKYELDMGEVSLSDEQMNAVRLMSIHKSKGLEFPVVIVAGLGKKFNTQDVRGEIVLHPDLGVGIDAIDLEKRTRAQTLLKTVIKKETQLENLGEELRVLYVALTRAKEKLIMVGTYKEPEEMIERWSDKQQQEELSFSTIAGAARYLDWLLPAVLSCPEKLIQIQTINLEQLAVESEIQETLDFEKKMEMLKEIETETADEKLEARIGQQFEYQYPFQEEQVKMKFSVSELKQRAAFPEEREETGERLIEEEEEIIPTFMRMEEELTGASRGSAYHKVMELLDFSQEYSEVSMKQQLEVWKTEGYLTKEMEACIEIEDILRFLNSSIGKRMSMAAKKGKLFKEQPFVLGVEAKEMYPDTDTQELVLIQGIIDAFFEEDGKIVVLDYKTDQIWKAETLIERYQEQLHLYAKALSRVLKKDVKERIIYSFTLKKEIKLQEG